jgi:hypothetical protein
VREGERKGDENERLKKQLVKIQWVKERGRGKEVKESAWEDAAREKER